MIHIADSLVHDLHFTIDECPASMNTFAGRGIGANKAYRLHKKQWASMVGMALIGQTKWLNWGNQPVAPMQKALVVVTHTFPTRRRRDRDNYNGKAILDGLVENGVLVDDTAHNVFVVVNFEYAKGIEKTDVKVVNLHERELLLDLRPNG